MNDARRYHDAMVGFQPPTQIEDVYLSQVARKQSALWERGLSFSEVEEMLSAQASA